MKIKDEFLKHISKSFRNVIFQNRTAECIHKVLSVKIGKSDNITMLPNIPTNIKVEMLDEEHDKVTFPYEDMEIIALFTWFKGNGGYVLASVE